MGRVCVIMQPSYLPWLGYFSLIDQADEFVLLDSVQFSHQGWQQRNRVRYKDGYTWLTVPARRPSKQKLCDVRIDHSTQFTRSHIGKIHDGYRKYAKCFELFYPEIKDAIIKHESTELLCEMTIQVMSRLGALLGMHQKFEKPFRRSSEMSVEGHRSELLVDICRAVDCVRYLSPIGSREYLLEDRAVFDDAGIEVSLQQYEHPRYDQGGAPFLSHLSIVDLLLHEGPCSLEVVRSGHRKPIELR